MKRRSLSGIHARARAELAVNPTIRTYRFVNGVEVPSELVGVVNHVLDNIIDTIGSMIGLADINTVLGVRR